MSTNTHLIMNNIVKAQTFISDNFGSELRNKLNGLLNQDKTSSEQLKGLLLMTTAESFRKDVVDQYDTLIPVLKHHGFLVSREEFEEISQNMMKSILAEFPDFSNNYGFSS